MAKEVAVDRVKQRYIAAGVLVLFLSPDAALQTPLDLQLLAAAERGDATTAAALLQRGADVDAENGYGITPLHYAADYAHLDLVEVLLQHGPDLEARDLVWGKTALRVAAVPWSDVDAPQARARLVSRLVESGAGSQGEALVDLLRGGFHDAVRAIVRRGHVEASYLNLALAGARDAGLIELTRFLEASGATEPTPLDSPRSPERLARLAGVYQSPSGTEIALTVDIDSGLLIERKGHEPLALVPSDLTFLRSRDREVAIRFSADPSASRDFELREGRHVERFTRIRNAPERSATRPIRSRTPPAAMPSHAVAVGSEWPSFRGAAGSGTAGGAKPPTTWDVERGLNVRWKTPVPGFGHSSPIVWGNRVFVTTAVPSANVELAFRHGEDVLGAGGSASKRDNIVHSWHVLAFNLKTGALLWDRVAHEAVPRTARHVMASHANQTPATDGKHLVAWFGSEGLFCYDFDGRLLWKKDLGTMPSGRYFDRGYEWNTASSPVIYKDRVIVQVDRLDDSYLAAFRLSDGVEMWRTDRDELPSWPTPLVYEGPPRTEIVTAAAKFARGYDPETGKELWRLGKHADLPTPTPVAGGGLIFVTSGVSGTIQPIYAIRPGASGDITLADDEDANQFVVWSKRRGGPYITTPIVHDDLLYICSNSGLLTAYQAQTGERVYQERLTRGGNYTSSPVTAGGHLYFANEEGDVVVIKAGRTFQHVATNRVGELMMATPAMSGGTLVLRTLHHLVAVAHGAR